MFYFELNALITIEAKQISHLANYGKLACSITIDLDQVYDAVSSNVAARGDSSPCSRGLWHYIAHTDSCSRCLPRYF